MSNAMIGPGRGNDWEVTAVAEAVLGPVLSLLGMVDRSAVAVCSRATNATHKRGLTDHIGAAGRVLLCFEFDWGISGRACCGLLRAWSALQAVL